MVDLVDFQDMKFVVPNKEHDYHTLGEAMHCILNYVGELDVVIDVGAHVGEVSLVAAKKGAKQVIAYEASSRNYQCLCENIRVNNFGDVITPHHLAVASVTGEKRRMFARISDLSGGDTFYGTPSRLLEEVETIGFKEVLHMHEKIDFLKIDVEGAEYEFITPDNEMRKLLKRVNFLDLETHSGWVSGRTRKDLRSKIEWNIGTHNRDLIKFIKSCGFHGFYGGYRR